MQVKADAPATEEQVVDVIERATRHPDFRPRSAVLVDVRAIREVPASRDLATTGQLLASHGTGHFSKMAFVADGPLQFGLTRMLGAHAESGGLEVQVFRREEDALCWLEQA